MIKGKYNFNTQKMDFYDEEGNKLCGRWIVEEIELPDGTVCRELAGHNTKHTGQGICGKHESLCIRNIEDMQNEQKEQIEELLQANSDASEDVIAAIKNLMFYINRTTNPLSETINKMLVDINKMLKLSAETQKTRQDMIPVGKLGRLMEDILEIIRKYCDPSNLEKLEAEIRDLSMVVEVGGRHIQIATSSINGE